MVTYICDQCSRCFDQKSKYYRHQNNKLGCKPNKKTNLVVKHYCDICKKYYNRKDALIRHLKSKLHEINIGNIIEINNTETNSKKFEFGTINGSYNKQAINSYNTTHNNNYYFISTFGKEEIDRLSTEDKLAIFLSKENPIVMIVIKTNLNPNIPEYHNVGYKDLNSKYGYIFNGTTWEKKNIQSIMNDLLSSKRKDLLKIHKEISHYLTIDDNNNIDDNIEEINNNIMPKFDYHTKSRKKLITNLKTYFYNDRHLIIDSIEKSGKPIMGFHNKNTHNYVLKDGLTVKELDKILKGNKQKALELEQKKESARYIIFLIKENIDKNQYSSIIDIINNSNEIYVVNIIMRLLCVTYYYGNSINIKLVNEKINFERKKKK